MVRSQIGRQLSRVPRVPTTTPGILEQLPHRRQKKTTNLLCQEGYGPPKKQVNQ
jgi:hypothetical protein